MDELVAEVKKLDLKINLQEQHIQAFTTFLQELMAWNMHTNLTAIREPHDIITKHFVDSLSVLKAIPASAKTIIDIGAGAGFPGLPVAIIQPDLEVTLVESIAKKTEFINHIAHILDLKNATVITSRAEELGQKADYREKYDVALSRAVAELRILAEYTLPLVKINGVFIAQKNQNAQEIQNAETAIGLLGGKVIEEMPVLVEKLSPRELIVIQKIKACPQEYPRAIGTPLRKPL